MSYWVQVQEEPEDLSIYEGKPYSNPHRQLMDDKDPLAWRVPQVKEDPELTRWFVRWIVLRETSEIIGSTSFHGAPDSKGMIEIGLGNAPSIHVIESFGFHYQGEQIDEEDRPEGIYEMSREEFLGKFGLTFEIGRRQA